MTEYEGAAYQSLERLKSEHDQEVIVMLEAFQSKAANRFAPSKKLLNYRQIQDKNFKLRQYDVAAQYEQMGNELEQHERIAFESKLQDSLAR